MTHVRRGPAEKRRRQQDAAERDERRSTLSPAQQLKVVNRRPGNSAKERARLKAQIQPKVRKQKKKESK